MVCYIFEFRDIYSGFFFRLTLLLYVLLGDSPLLLITWRRLITGVWHSYKYSWIIYCALDLEVAFVVIIRGFFNYDLT